MARQRTKRVPEEAAQLVFERLNRSGELALVLAVLEDHADAVDERLRGLLASHTLVTEEDKAEFQRGQGALAEIERIIVAFEMLGTREDPRETPVEELFARPPRTRHSKGPAAR